MFAKVYNFKFPGLSEAKVAATFCSEKLGKKIELLQDAEERWIELEELKLKLKKQNE